MTHQTIPNIGSIRTYNGNLYICHRSGELFENGIPILQKVESHSFWSKDEWIYFHDLTGNHCFYNRNTQATFRGEFGVAWFSINGSRAFCSFDVDWVNLKWKSGLLDIEKQKVVQEISSAANKSLISSTKDHYLLAEGKQGISGVSKQSTKTVWTFSLGALGRWYHDFDKKWVEGTIQQIVTVVNDTLWLTVSGHHLIGIDTRTGHILHKLSDASEVIGKPTKAYHCQLPVTFRLEHDPIRQHLFGFIYDTYVEIDLTTDQPSLTMYVLEEACSQHQAFCAYGERTCFDNKYFFYLDPMTGKIGCLNRENKVVEWVYSFPEGSTMGVLMQIEITSTHLYVLDSGGTLHIFERER